MTRATNSSSSSFRARWMLVALVAVTLAGCNGPTPSAPTSPSAIALPDGDYLLTISLGFLPPIGGSPVFCMSTAPGQSLSTRGVFPVRLARSGQGWTIRMPQSSGAGGGSLEIRLTAAGSTVTGTISGTARTADEAVTLTMPSPTPLSGSQQASSNTIDGQIEGDVRLETDRGGITCRPGSWMLAPR